MRLLPFFLLSVITTSVYAEATNDDIIAAINNSSSNVILGVSQIFTRPLNNSYSSALNIPT
ncbi:hypothetical protein EBS02_04625, partial [bacterium]|nr:hypothetical protein [bacterium]